MKGFCISVPTDPQMNCPSKQVAPQLAAESRSDSATMTLTGRRTDPVAMLR